jgi:cell division protein FtsW (lipid II flippase)
MASEEKRAWIMLVVSACAYAIYLLIVLGRRGEAPLTEVAYASTMLWTIAGAIVASIVLHIVVSIADGSGGKKDQRDREINRFGEHIGQSFVVLGGVVALVMALLELDHFWIANAIYLAFVLSALLSSTAKIFAYRKGFHPW